MEPRTILSCLACLVAISLGAPVPVEGGSAEEKTTAWGFLPDPGLPDVLLIGDSISIGYTPFVRGKLAGAANVFRPMESDGKKAFNCGDTARALALLDDWLEDRSWRVIHFNFGLHDLKWLNAKGAYVAPDQGSQVAPLPVYEKNLSELAARLRKTGAHLIWGSTTPVPEGTLGRVAGDEKRYNEAAERVMAANGIAINDLAGALGSRLSELQLPRNVHFTDAGSDVLADAVVRQIRVALVKPWDGKSVDRSYPKRFELAEPFRAEITKPSTFLGATVRFPRPMRFRPGQRLVGMAELSGDGVLSSFAVQIQSRDGKVSSLSPKGPVGKTMAFELILPESPALHAVSRNKEAWKEGDLISRIQCYWRTESESTGVVIVHRLALSGDKP